MKRGEIIVDAFAGGGGASLGLEWALKRSPNIAVNHDPEAIAMHEANHPDTLHLRSDIREVDIAKYVKGRKVGHAHFSPDCTFHSKARGSKPIREKGKKIRALAWVVCDWAKLLKPRVITVENVAEMADWGPVVPKVKCERCEWGGTMGQTMVARKRPCCPQCRSVRIAETDEYVPDKDKKGITFKRWVGRLRALGYDVQWRVLNAADYGAPTARKRLFVIARNDGEMIYWPTPSHAAPKAIAKHPEFRHCKPYRTAAECIDWTIECPSIFDRESQGKKPLVEKTMKRIAFGMKPYVLDAETPFIVPITHSGERRCHPMDEPMPTITGAKRGEHAVCAPILSKYHHSTSENDPRCKRPDQPLDTLDTQPRYSLVSAFIAKHFGGVIGQPAKLPLPTTTTSGCQNQVVAASLVRHNGGAVGKNIDEPLPTATLRNTQNQVLAAHMVRQFGNSVGQSIDDPAPTQTGGPKTGIAAAHLIHANYGGKQWSSVEEPQRTITAGRNHAYLVYSFLAKYFGTAIGQPVDEPLGTVTSKARYGLVTVHVNGEAYVIVDIGMRMLTPRELARCQGFPDDYVLTGTKTNQIAKIGNSVCPHVMKAIAEVNLAPMPKGQRNKRKKNPA